MKVVISSGHGKYIRGAAGPEPWGLDEVDEARKVTERVAAFLRSAGVSVTTFHDDVSQSLSENLDRIVDFHNAQGAHDLDVSIHFNAYENTTTKEMGTECLYVSQEALSAKVSRNIADATSLPDRGAKYRGDLAFLNGTNEPAILVETLFCDAKPDCDAYRAHFDEICGGIAAAISGVEVDTPPPEQPGEPGQPPELGPELPIAAGDEGDDVEEVQRILGLPQDGDFGSITETGVEQYQGAYGLAKSGVVDEATWKALQELDAKMAAGDYGISPELDREIDELCDNSPVNGYTWEDRGIAPDGYYHGMAKAFAWALQRPNEEAVGVMSEAASNSEYDALNVYSGQLEDEGITAEADGPDTLQALFVLMVGLGMRESSGNHWEGRDMSADNVEADTCEAGLFQTSWNIHTADSAIPPLLERFWGDPNGFRPTFSRNLPPTSSNLDAYGSGPGARYQFLAKYSPNFHILVTGVGLRKRCNHWGPINRGEVEIVGQVDDLLTEVQQLVLQPARPERPPERPDMPPIRPDGDPPAHVTVTVRTEGNVVVDVVQEPGPAREAASAKQAFTSAPKSRGKPKSQPAKKKHPTKSGKRHPRR